MVTRKLLDGLRKGAHPESANGLLYKAACEVLEQRDELADLAEKVGNWLTTTNPWAPGTAEIRKLVLAALRKAGRPAPVTAEFVNPRLDALLEDLERDPHLRPGG